MKVENLERFKRKLKMMPIAAKEEIRKALMASAVEITALMKAAAPVDSGDLQRSIGYTFGNYRPDNSNVRGVSATAGGHDLSVTLHAGDKHAWYAALVEFGTTAHTIKAKNAPAMGRGGIFGSIVHHPGSSAHPFFYPSYRLGKKRAKSQISRAVSKAAKKAASGS